jgi:opacity protein-like surface antigen
MKKIILLGLIFASVMTLSAFADEGQKTDKKDQEQELPYIKEIGMMTGYAHGILDEKGSYKIIPAILRLGYSMDSWGLGFCDLIRPLANKLKMAPKGYTGLINELHLNTVFAPDRNLEVGWTLLIKYSYPVTEKFHPYLIGGGGVQYISQHTREQSTQWGFTPQFGTGFSYFFKKNLALNLEYRRKHFSNASIRSPNRGINVNMFLIGISWFH